MTQLLDTSADQQDAARDYAAGVQLALADLKRTRRPVPELTVVETDGSDGAVRQAIAAVANDPRQVALIGTAGERLAMASVKEATRIGLDIAHVAPWLADSEFDGDSRFFGLFASRAEQIKFVLGNLASIGVRELAVIFPSSAQAHALRTGTLAITNRLGIRARLTTVPTGADLTRFAAALPTDTPFFMLFMGGSVQLALFTRGLEGRGSQRYVVCLSDVDPNTFQQFQPGRAAAIIFTQVVPNPQSSKVRVVRSYREALNRLMDEAPSPLSLAGYLAGRYAATVLETAGSDASRGRVLAEFRRRDKVELDGWQFAFHGSGRASNFVSQTLLGSGGKLID